ncbi:MAG: hypothetical protein ABFD92_05175 [Planctomycetaceae bacterium]|nr:hypothetical protein [Planctomycetaceae bacterium]
MTILSDTPHGNITHVRLVFDPGVLAAARKMWDDRKVAGTPGSATQSSSNSLLAPDEEGEFQYLLSGAEILAKAGKGKPVPDVLVEAWAINKIWYFCQVQMSGRKVTRSILSKPITQTVRESFWWFKDENGTPVPATTSFDFVFPWLISPESASYPDRGTPGIDVAWGQKHVPGFVQNERVLLAPGLGPVALGDFAAKGSQHIWTYVALIYIPSKGPVIRMPRPPMIVRREG